MEFHPFADTWPLLDDAELAKLAADIKANGLRLAIITYQGKILDGRNRDKACRKAGVEPRYEIADAKTDEEALALVWSLNEHRRHASVEQRAFAAERIANLKNGLRKDRADVATSSEVATRDEAAKLMGVTLQAFERARAIRAHAPELEQPVHDKKMSLSAAAEQARAKRREKRQRESLKYLGQTARQRAIEAREERRHTIKPLTREQVDPDFQGTPLEYVEKHGHVQLMSGADKDAQRRRLNITGWTGAIGQMAAIAKNILKLADIDPTTWNETIAQRKLRLAENLAVIDQAMERIHANGMRPPANGKGTRGIEARP